MRKRILGLVALAAIATPLAFASSANAAVTVDGGTGTGFVGKGDVQTALGWNNATLQKNANSLAFTTTQDVTQSLTQKLVQRGSQVGTQTATQSVMQYQKQVATQAVSQDLSCTVEQGRVTFHRDGEREGVREGKREGVRTGVREGTRTADRTGLRDGTREGTQTGRLASKVAYDTRDKKQITGFNLTSTTATNFTPSDVAAWDEPVWDPYDFYGSYTFSGPYTFGPSDYSQGVSTWFGDFAFEGDAGIAWGAWTGDGADPGVCLGGNPGISDLTNVTTDGAVTDGAVTYEQENSGNVTERPGVADGAITDGEIGVYAPEVTGTTPTGPLSMFVNGVALPITPAPVVEPVA